MFHKIDDFLRNFGDHTGATMKLFGALTDETLGQAVAEGHRTLGGMAWHIVTTIPEMMSRTGLKVTAVDPESPPPAKVQEIVDGYERAIEDLAGAIQGAWTDESLEERDDMYGMQWPRGLTLAILLHHEIHHRGQMTVLMRQAGLTVPGMMGPSKEEWGQFGMPEPAY